MVKGKKIKRRSNDQEQSEGVETRVRSEQFKRHHELIEELIEGLKSEIER